MSLGNVDFLAISDVIVIQVKMRISAEIMMPAMLLLAQDLRAAIKTDEPVGRVLPSEIS
jgi:hypothetical protein